MWPFFLTMSQCPRYDKFACFLSFSCYVHTPSDLFWLAHNESKRVITRNWVVPKAPNDKCQTFFYTKITESAIQIGFRFQFNSFYLLLFHQEDASQSLTRYRILIFFYVSYVRGANKCTKVIRKQKRRLITLFSRNVISPATINIFWEKRVE